MYNVNFKLHNKMGETSQKITQRQLFIAELQWLSNDITPNDRAKLMDIMGFKSTSTLSNYLNGTVRNLDTAANIITHAKALIAERNKVLS